MTQSTLSTSNVALTIEAVKKAVDSLLELFFTTHIERAHTLDDHYGKLWESARNLSQAGGKRLRPYMTILAYQAYSGASTESIMPVAAALEVLHLGLLVHDDIIDRDYIRYGTDNISGQFSKLYEPYIDDVHECRHFSDSAAILAGDLLLVGGHELIHSADLPPQSMIEASRIYNDAVFMVAGGELLDTESAFRSQADNDALKIARTKTAHYSFVTPLLMGAYLANVSHKDHQALTAFGEHLGIAYQLVDDMLGVFGDEAVTGKSAMNDLREAKHTYLIERFWALATHEQRTTFKIHFGDVKMTKDDAIVLRDLLVESGATAATESMIEQHVSHARQTVSLLSINDAHRQEFEQLIERSAKRKY